MTQTDTQDDISPIAESVVRSAANILGPRSAAARALAEANRRRADGHVVTFHSNNGAFEVRSAPLAIPV